MPNPLKLRRPLVALVAVGTLAVGAYCVWWVGGTRKSSPSAEVDGDGVKVLRGRLYVIPTGMSERDLVPMKNVGLRIHGATENFPTNDFGEFRIELAEPVRPGEDVKLQPLENGYVVIHPDLRGRLRIPRAGGEIDVWAVKNTDRFILTNSSIERIVEDVREQAVKRVRLPGDKVVPDWPGEFERLVRDYGFDKAAVKDQIREWGRLAKDSPDLEVRPLAAFAREDYLLADKLLTEAAEEDKRQANRHHRGAADHLEKAGGAALMSGRFDAAVDRFRQALEELHLERPTDESATDRVTWELAAAQLDVVRFARPVDASARLEEARVAIQNQYERLERRPDAIASSRADAKVLLGHTHRLLGSVTYGDAAGSSLKRAAEEYQSALEYYRRDRHPHEWSVATFSLATCWGELAERVPSSQASEVIEWSTDLLRQLEGSVPEATDANTIRNAQNLIGLNAFRLGERAEPAAARKHFRTAETAFRKVIAGLTGRDTTSKATRNRDGAEVVSRPVKASNRDDWALVQFNLGRTLCALANVESEPVAIDLLSEAKNVLKECLSVFTRDLRPYDWAKTHLQFGIALAREAEIVPPRAKSLRQQAIEEFKNAQSLLTPELRMHDWAVAQENAAVCLLKLGQQAGGDVGKERFEEALGSLRSLTTPKMLETEPSIWANSQLILGHTLTELAESAPPPQRSKHYVEAEQAYLQVTTVRTKGTSPQEWADAMVSRWQCRVNYASDNEVKDGDQLIRQTAVELEALQAGVKKAENPQLWADITAVIALCDEGLGDRGKRPDTVALYKRAKDGYRQASEVFDPVKTPREHANQIKNMATASRKLASNLPDAEAIPHLLEAAEGYQAWIRQNTRSIAPRKWAAVHNDLGLVYHSLGEFIRDDSKMCYLYESEQAYLEVMSVVTEMNDTRLLGVVLHNLGNMRYYTGAITPNDSGIQILLQSVESHKAALQIISLEANQLNWAATHFIMGLSQLHLGNRLRGPKSIKLLSEAIDSFKTSLKGYTLKDYPLDWLKGQKQVAEALQLLSKRLAGREAVEPRLEAVRTYRTILRQALVKEGSEVWGDLESDLGNALQLLADGLDGKEHDQSLQEAIFAYQCAQRFYTRSDHPIDWADLSHRIAYAHFKLGKNQTGEVGIRNLKTSIATYRDAMAVLTEPGYREVVRHMQSQIAEIEKLIQQRDK